MIQDSTDPRFVCVCGHDGQRHAKDFGSGPRGKCLVLRCECVQFHRVDTVGTLEKVRELETGETVLSFAPTGDVAAFFEAAKRSGMAELSCSGCGRPFLTRETPDEHAGLCPPCRDPSLR